jgi:hypothetical protein
MLAGAGLECRVPAVVHAHGDNVADGADGVRDIDRKARVSAAMSTDLSAVDVHVGDLKHAVEFEKQSLAAPVGGHVNRSPIPTRSHVKLRCAEVGQVERVRQVHALP